MSALFNNGRAFAAIVERARPGSAIPYHIGFLSCDAQRDNAVKDVAKMARALSVGSLPADGGAFGGSMQYGQGVGTLVQRKLGEAMYEYIFIKSRRAV